MQTNRGGKYLHYEGYMYLKIREGKEGSIFWRCQLHKSGCNGRATSKGSSVVVRNEHNHPPAQATRRKEKAVANMRKRAREETTSINRIYDETLQVISAESGSEGVAAELPTFYSIKYSLYRSRRTPATYATYTCRPRSFWGSGVKLPRPKT